MKELTSREIAAIKRIAQNADADYQQVCKINQKIAKLQEERDRIQENLNLTEAPVVSRYGYPSTTLVKKEIIPLYNEDGTPKTDKEGRPMKQTKYVWVGFPVEQPEATVAENTVAENVQVAEENVEQEETVESIW